jgi:hypothetical protein
MQLTPDTAAEIHRIFDDPEPAENELDETRYVDEERYGSRAPRLVEVRALLTWLAIDDGPEPIDGYDTF